MNRARRSRLSRGAATVEMAICVVILVPTILYTLFLEDLLYFKLEQYESLSSPAWDYLPIDYNKASPKANVAGIARQTYCDHTSLYNSYDQPFECGDNHHDGTVTTAHQCWLVRNPPARQVYCSTDPDDYLSSSSDLRGLSDFNDTYNEGGVFNCNARLGVMNFFILNKFFTWSEKRNAGNKSYQVTGKNRYKSGNDDRQGDDVHGNAARGTGVDSSGSGDIVLAEENFSVLHDPWATNYPPNTTGDVSYGRFHDRMAIYFDAQKDQSGEGVQEAVDFKEAAVSDGVLGDEADTDNFGDDPMTPTVAWDRDDNTRTVNRHTASGWEDPRQQGSFSSRQDNYFGRAPGWW